MGLADAAFPDAITCATKLHAPDFFVNLLHSSFKPRQQNSYSNIPVALLSRTKNNFGNMKWHILLAKTGDLSRLIP
jgi:hypothetical protein